MNTIAENFVATQTTMKLGSIDLFRNTAISFLEFLIYLATHFDHVSQPNIVPRQQAFVQASLHLQNAIHVAITTIEEATNDQIHNAFIPYVQNQFNDLADDFEIIRYGWIIVRSVMDNIVQHHGFIDPVPHLITALGAGLEQLAQMCDHVIEFTLNMSIVTNFLNGIIPHLQNARIALVGPPAAPAMANTLFARLLLNEAV